MIKHTLTKKQQLVLCAMYVESLGDCLEIQAVFQEPDKRRLNVAPGIRTSLTLLNYLQDYGLVGINASRAYPRWNYAITPSGVALAKALIKVLS